MKKTNLKGAFADVAWGIIPAIGLLTYGQSGFVIGLGVMCVAILVVKIISKRRRSRNSKSNNKSAPK